MITLKSTKTAFEAWRAARANTAMPIPAKLWGMVKHLLSIHQKTKICKTLRLSGGQIKKHCTASAIAKNKKVIQQSQAPKTPPNNDFVTAMPLPAAKSTIEKSTSELILKGSSKSLHLSIPTAALCDVLPVLGELL